jgi:hypothetical protein
VPAANHHPAVSDSANATMPAATAIQSAAAGLIRPVTSGAEALRGLSRSPRTSYASLTASTDSQTSGPITSAPASTWGRSPADGTSRPVASTSPTPYGTSDTGQNCGLASATTSRVRRWDSTVVTAPSLPPHRSGGHRPSE